MIDRLAVYICQNIAKLIFCSYCNSGELLGSFIPLVIPRLSRFCFVSFCVRRTQPQHYCFYVLLVLQPVRGQSALGSFIINNNNNNNIINTIAYWKCNYTPRLTRNYFPNDENLKFLRKKGLSLLTCCKNIRQAIFC